MATVRLTTRYVSWNRPQAGGILALTGAAIAWGVFVALTQPTVVTPAASEASSDGQLYRRIVERVHGGEPYYDVAGWELRAGTYPTGSVFNWRPPLYAWMFGHLPDPNWARAVLILAALATFRLAFIVVQREAGRPAAAAAALLLLSALGWAVIGPAYLFMELWSGVLIALSVLAYAQGDRGLGWGFGIFALFFRELALPYCLLALLFALLHHRHGEVKAWLAGLALYALYLGMHSLEVVERITGSDHVHEGGWVQFGGTAFVLGTCQMNIILMYFPAWLTALCLPVALLGLAGWPGPTGARVALTVGTYVAAFTVAGNPACNCYWGLLYAPLLPFGLLWAPAALRDLRAAVLHPASTGR